MATHWCITSTRNQASQVRTNCVCNSVVSRAFASSPVLCMGCCEMYTYAGCEIRSRTDSLCCLWCDVVWCCVVLWPCDGCLTGLDWRGGGELSAFTEYIREFL